MWFRKGTEPGRQRTGASRFAQGQIEHHRRLAPVADLYVRREKTMKAFLAGIVAAVVMALAFGFWHSVHTADWIICAVKVPGEAAIRDIQADIDARRMMLRRQRSMPF